MKVRNGFVSNSSSSSFCIFGVSLDENTIRSYMKPDVVQEAASLLAGEDDPEDRYELAEMICTGTGLEYHLPDGYSEIFIGKDWSSVKDDQTGRQFKDSVIAVLREKLPGIKDEDFQTYEEAYYS